MLVKAYMKHMKTLQTSGILTNEKHFTAHQKKNYADP
jgi:hypothetical protein